MLEDEKHYWKLLTGVAVLGLASLACRSVYQPYYQFIQEIDCEASGGQWKEDIYDDVSLGYYCENAGTEYNQKYFPTSTPIASPTPEPSPSNTQETSPTGTTPSIVEPSPTDPDTPNIVGMWHGTAQWICDTNPIWSTSLEFRSNGMVSATLSTTTDTTSADGSWEINGNEIRLQFERGLWVGTISENTISGTFVEENCNGVWSVSKD